MPSTINAQTTPFAAIVQTADNTGNLAFQTANVTAMTITTSQNVGFGTASPVVKLDVVGQIKVGAAGTPGFTTYRNTVMTSGFDVGSLGGDSSGEGFVYNRQNASIVFGTNNTERMRLDASGNLGIGTTSPASFGKLTVSGSEVNTVNAAIVNTSQTSQYLSINMAGATGSGISGWDNSGIIEAVANSVGSGTRGLVLSAFNGPIIFQASSRTERFRIGASGQLGIGGANYGTSGQVLTSGGSGAAPSWTTVAVTPAAVSDQNNTSTGYFDLPTGTTAQRPGSPAAGYTRYNTTLNLVEVYNGSVWVAVGDQSTFYSVEYLVIAGGGGGCGTGGGGGGAGGFRTSVSGATSGGGSTAESTIQLISLTNYTVTIGGGGTGFTNQSRGTNGSASVFGSITSTGGGAGAGNASSLQGNSGGSGGGGSSRTSQADGGSGTTGQGYAGGTGGLVSGNQSNSRGGGGGGAGAVGLGNSSGSVRADGGAGVASSITGSSVTYAGGGGGGSENYDAGLGGSGGGGNGGRYPDLSTYPAAVNGTANTGGGGGGGYQTAANGGSGIVIIRYAGSQRGTGGTVTSSGGYTIHTFTTSGTYTA